MVCDVQAWGDPFVGFVGMRISIPQKGERTNVVGEEIWDMLFKS
jgi:hypothetical protein